VVLHDRTSLHRRWLLAAGLYNLGWGAVVVLSPELFPRLAGMDAFVGPSRGIWQCLGMVIGVFGVGYLCASLDPVRHWPITLVGLLGKIFGPIGFVWCASRGEIPWSFGWTILTNDLLWWIPFAMILRDAWRRSIQDETHLPVLTRGEALAIAVDQHGTNLIELSRERRLLVVFLRHFGCTFCREAIADLLRDEASLRAHGVSIVVVHMATEAEAAGFLASHGAAHWHRVSDPRRRIHAAFGLTRGSFFSLFGPMVWWRGTQALAKGHGAGQPVGDPLQMPGVFVIHRGRVQAEFRHETAGDRPDYEGLSGSIAS
jgi:peroxiredoxin